MQSSFASLQRAKTAWFHSRSAGEKKVKQQRKSTNKRKEWVMVRHKWTEKKYGRHQEHRMVISIFLSIWGCDTANVAGLCSKRYQLKVFSLDTPKHFIITKVLAQVRPPLKEHFSSLQCMCVCYRATSVIGRSEGRQVKCVIFTSVARLKYISDLDITTPAHPMEWVWGHIFFSQAMED